MSLQTAHRGEPWVLSAAQISTSATSVDALYSIQPPTQNLSTKHGQILYILKREKKKKKKRDRETERERERERLNGTQKQILKRK